MTPDSGPVRGSSAVSEAGCHESLDSAVDSPWKRRKSPGELTADSNRDYRVGDRAF